MKKFMSLVIMLTVAVIMLPMQSNAQNLSFTAGGGITSFTGDGSEYWNMGFHLAGQGFFALTPNILIGGRIAYNRVSPDQDQFINEFEFNGVNVNVSGSGSVVELLPSVRFQTAVSPDQSVVVFGQGGLGLYLASLDATVEISYQNYNWKETVGESSSDFGFCFGGGIGFAASENLKLEILPLYHIIPGDGESTNYFSVTASIVLQK
jgi:opacity protein-like surface antigen